MNSNGRHSADDALAQLRREVHRVLSAHPSAEGDDRIHRLETPLTDATPLAWLSGRQDDHHVYWSDRDHVDTLAGVGVTCEIRSDEPVGTARTMEAIRTVLERSSANVRFVGGIRFDVKRPASGEWRAYGTARFVVPRIELRASDAGATLAVNLCLPRDTGRIESVAKCLESCFEPGPGAPWAIPHTENVDRFDTPEREQWTTAVTSCVGTFEREEADKIVLARRTDFLATNAPNALALLSALERETPSSFHFFFAPGEGSAFLGASPERLYRRTGNRLETEALAGTRRRGVNDAEDVRLQNELEASDKEHREHAAVARGIRRALHESCDIVSEGAREVLKLRHCQHLLNRFHGTLRGSISDGDIIQTLHPTPAVGGVPKQTAIDHIRQLEAFDRGWYTGPVGWVSRDAAEFAVAIRSALVHDTRVSVYTGAGIVAGSDPDEEWHELENKLADFRALLESTPVSAYARS